MRRVVYRNNRQRLPQLFNKHYPMHLAIKFYVEYGVLTDFLGRNPDNSRLVKIQRVTVQDSRILELAVRDACRPRP